MGFQLFSAIHDVRCTEGRPSRRVLLIFAVAIFVAGFLAPCGRSQGLDPSLLLKTPTDTWPTYNGDYSGARYSTLAQINAGNVGALTIAWAFRTHGNTLKSTPLEVNGILYFSSHPGSQ